MAGCIESGQLCTIVPCRVEDAQVGDIVLCKVHGAEFLHLVKAVGQDGQVLMPPDELRQFVDDFVSNRIFTSAHLRENDDIAMVFMPVALGAFSGWSDTGLERIGVLWEYLSQAGPMAINGLPCFFSFHVLNADDWKIAREAILREQERRKNIEL